MSVADPFPKRRIDEGAFIRSIRDHIEQFPSQTDRLIQNLYSHIYGYPSLTTIKRWTGLSTDRIKQAIDANRGKNTKRIQFTRTNEPQLKKTINATKNDDVWQIDLLDLRSVFSHLINPELEEKKWDEALKRIFPKQVFSARYCLVVLDTYSRKVIIETTAKKEAWLVRNAMARIMGTEQLTQRTWTEPKLKPNVIYCDYGGEFKGDFSKLMNRFEIKMFHPRNIFYGGRIYEDQPAHDPDDTKYEGHCAMVERVIRTLKEIVFKVLNSRSAVTNHTVNEFMDHIANIYNNRYHSSIGMTPQQKYDGEMQDMRKHRMEYYLPKPIRLPKFKVGDMVYLKYQTKLFDKGYIEKFAAGTPHQVVRVIPRISKDDQMFFTYHVMIDEWHAADFYEEMLTK